MLFAIPACDDLDAEMLLHEYLDGELEPGRHPDLFSHLAACAGCREQFDALLAFRLAARQEPLLVPPTVDAALFARLDTSRRRTRRLHDRRNDRAPLGGALRQSVSVGAMLVIALVAILAGTLIASDTPPPRVVEAVLEDGTLYVIDPGVTVEANRE